MADRPIAETIRALQELRDVAGREAGEVESAVAGEIEAVLDVLRPVRAMVGVGQFAEIGHVGLGMIDRVQQAGREVSGAVDGEIGGLHDLLRDETGDSLADGGVVSPGLATQYPRFENRDPDDLDAELARAESLGVRRMPVDDSEFDEVVNAGKVKWAVLPDGELYVMRKFVDGDNDDFAHTVLTEGGPVVAAGEAYMAGSNDVGYFGLAISNYSGHYEPPPHTLEIGLAAFADAGIHFAEDGQERMDG